MKIEPTPESPKLLADQRSLSDSHDPIPPAVDDAGRQEGLSARSDGGETKTGWWPKPTVWVPLALAAVFSLATGVWMVLGDYEARRGDGTGRVPPIVDRDVRIVSNAHLGDTDVSATPSAELYEIPLAGAVEVFVTTPESTTRMPHVAVVIETEEGARVILRAVFDSNAYSSANSGEPWTESLVGETTDVSKGAYVTLSQAQVKAVLPTVTCRKTPGRAVLTLVLSASPIDDNTLMAVVKQPDKSNSPDSPSISVAKPIHIVVTPQ